MSNDEHISRLSYDEIISVAQAKAKELRSTLPTLPSDEELEPYEGKMWTIDRPLIDAVQRHLDKHEQAHGHSFDEHHSWVAKLGAYVADKECESKGIRGELREDIIQRTWRLGLLHDIERWLGCTPLHQIEGLKQTRIELRNLSIKDRYLEDQVLLHDNLEVQTRNNPAFDVPFFSVFAVDHLSWGREWEREKWEGLRRKNTNPGEAIHDYKFLYKLQQSSNLQQTNWGKNVALPYINFGIKIAEHVEKTFSSKTIIS